MLVTEERATSRRYRELRGESALLNRPTNFRAGGVTEGIGVAIFIERSGRRGAG